MPRVDTDNFDLDHVEDPSDLSPRPTLVVDEDDDYSMNHLGDEGNRLMKQLLDATDDDDAAEERIFGTLGVDDYDYVEWDDQDLFWADEDEMLDALEDWNSADNL